MAPVQKTRAEIRLIRLLSRCEEMAGSDDLKDWRLENHVGALEERLQEVKKLSDTEKPKDDVIKEYSKKIEFLKRLLENEKLPVTSKKSLANQLASPADTRTIQSNISTPTGKQIQIKTSSRYSSEMRDELLLTEKQKSEGIRHRGTGAYQNMKDADTFLQHQQKQHELIAEEMVALTRNLKHNIKASNKVIKEDLTVIDKSIKQTDSNFGRLQQESARLESHLTKGANWWLWISLATVVFIFLFMIFFIRFFPK